MTDPKRGARPASSAPLRADAVANRAKVVAAARAAFTAEGPDVSLDEIARRAGVGAGTVHRHFATKADLVETVLAAAVEDLVATASTYAESEEPGAALRAFLVHLVTEGAATHELAARLRVRAGDVDAAVSGPVADLDRAMALLLSRAHDAGAVHADVDERDLAAIVAAAHAAYVHPLGGERAVALVLRALD
ncbi:TetR/AcrR family transcriptional regulator [Nocardioides sp. YIM B13467]|uniref:TetR/AcrR family transcriptional regulator n=1 Tax=Nocardioides sp. YIM B13467 TaxID=3366294 RepID=UPI00366C9638